MARLKVLTGCKAGQNYMLTDDVSLGRNNDNAISFTDSQISRKHARLIRQGTDFFIEDLDSVNGTILRGKPLLPHTPCLLQDGDEIGLGSVRLVFYTDELIPWQLDDDTPSPHDTALPLSREAAWRSQSPPLGVTLFADEQPSPHATVVIDASELLAKIEASATRGDTELQEMLKRFHAMCQVSIALGSIKDQEALLHKIMGCLFDIFPAVNRAFIVLKEQDSDTLVPIVARQRHGFETSQPPLAMSRTIVNQVLMHKQAILSCDAMDDERFKSQESIINLSIRSMMCAPLLVGDEILGLIQVDTCTGQSLFSAEDLQMLIGISNQIAIAMKNVQLVNDFKRLFESLIDLIVTAIDERSRYTAGHCRRVPILTMLLAEAACRQQEGPLKDFTLSAEELYELQVAALLHDCGKLSVPMYVVDKATKLEAVFDRIGLIDTRFEILHRDAEIALLRQKLAALGGDTLTPAEQMALDASRQQLLEARDFLHSCNIGSESMSESSRHRVQALAQHYTWHNIAGEQMPLLSDDEVHHLTVLKGTLTPEEREVMNSHAAITIKMLKALPYPPYLRQVPLLAGVHHERMDGTGYPGGYTKDEIPMGGRIMGIADIFEALTAPDRPYKKGKTLMESLQILGQMKLDGHIDPDLFDVFIKERVYQTYAEAYLTPDQIDPVNVADIPGYTPTPQTPGAIC
jgi:HD-GYP domain-containing protein (c-di-GMP phosphodiesterase class II)